MFFVANKSVAVCLSTYVHTTGVCKRLRCLITQMFVTRRDVNRQKSKGPEPISGSDLWHLWVAMKLSQLRRWWQFFPAAYRRNTS